MKSGPSNDPELVNIISSALEMLDQGIEPPIEQLCGDRKDLVQEVRVAIRIADDLPAVRERASNLDPYLGRVLGGRYLLEARLGSGAMGVVYRAEDQQLHRKVAVKILRADTLVAEEASERFVREAELMAAIRHPSVVTLFDRDQTDVGEQFLVMELLEGRSLADLLETGWKRAASGSLESTDWVQEELESDAITEPTYLRLVVGWAADLASGLSAAHQAGIYHRDVKPSNVFVGSDAKPQLLDFGIASSSQHVTLMREGGALGTPAYMAPEALSEDSDPGPELDVYGLTATLYHMLVMQAPYSGSPSQIIAKLGHQDPKPAYQLRPGLPLDLQAILDKGMSRRASQRYGSALELETDLRAFLQYRPVAARPITPFVRAWRKVRRSTAFQAATAVALLGLALVGGLRWKEAQDAQKEVARHAAYMDAYEHFPPGLTLGPASSRRLDNDEERAAIQELLDDAVRWSAESIPSRSLRASFRLDHGDTKGAAADMAVVAAEFSTPYTEELSARYARLASQVGSQAGLDLRALPEPESPMDLYLAAYHGIRTRNFQPVRDWLEHESLADFVPAQELLIPLIDKMDFSAGTNSLSPEEFVERASGSLRNYSRAVRLEERLGQRTATTAFLIGTTLTSRKLYKEAIEPYRSALELCPWSYGLNLNLGVAERRLRNAEAAEHHLRAAIELRPKQLDPYKTLIRLYIAEGELGRARELFSSSPLGEEGHKSQGLVALQADVEFVQAMIHRREGDRDGAIKAATLAVSLYRQADAMETRQARICQAVVSGEEDRVFGMLLQILREDPLQWYQLDTLLDWIPEDLSADDLENLRAYLGNLKDALMRRGN